MSRKMEVPELFRWIGVVVFGVVALPAVVAAFFALLAAYRSTMADERDLRIVSREAEVSIGMRRYRKSSGTYPVLMVTESLTLTGNGHTFHTKVTGDLDKDKFFTEEFLRAYRPGETVRVTVAPDGRSVEIGTGGEKKKALGLGVMVLILGWFAWVMWPLLIEGTRLSGMGVKFGVLGFALIVWVGGAFYYLNRENTTAEQIRREPVSGTVKSMPLAEALRELEGKGLKIGPGVDSRFSDPVYYSEFEYKGQKWRARARWSAAGIEAEGRVNPENPHDVIWGDRSN